MKVVTCWPGLVEPIRRAGHEPVLKPPCEECHGKGYNRAIRDWRQGDDAMVNQLPCHYCDGRGYLP